MKKIVCLPLAFSIMLLVFASCNSEKAILLHELFKTSPDGKFYTAHNIWHDKDGKTPIINFQQGEILPFGTEIKLKKTILRREIVFEDVKSKKEYRVIYSRNTAIVELEDFIKELFTTKTPEELVEGIKPEILEKIKLGIVEKRMNKKEVILAYGFPSVHRTPSRAEDTWIYFDDVLKLKRVVFSKRGFVVDIIRSEPGEGEAGK